MSTVKAKKDRVLVMSLSACLLSMLSIFAKRFYDGASALPYDPSMLFLLSFVTSSMLLACALTVLACKNKRILFIMTTVMSATVVCATHILLGASAAETLLSLAFVPSSAVLALCIKNGCEKTHTVVANSVILSLVFVFALLLGLYEIFGEISTETLAHIKLYIKESFDAIYSSYDYTALGITSAQISDMFETTVLMFPAIACALICALSYIQATLTRLLVLDRNVCNAEIGHWPLKMSRLASVAFLFTFVAVAFGIGQGSTLFYITAANLMIVLTPGFLLIGIRSAPSRFKRPSLFGMIFGILILIYCIQNPAILLLVFSISGAFDNLFSAFRERFYGEKKEKK